MNKDEHVSFLKSTIEGIEKHIEALKLKAKDTDRRIASAAAGPLHDAELRLHHHRFSLKELLESTEL